MKQALAILLGLALSSQATPLNTETKTKCGQPKPTCHFDDDCYGDVIKLGMASASSFCSHFFQSTVTVSSTKTVTSEVTDFSVLPDAKTTETEVV